MEHSPESKFVSWLPVYHDMGLIGGILQPLYGGFPCILMSPAAFLQRPYRWLQAISHYQGTTSGAPNFAYELCINKITPEQRATLDLSSWSVAFNGAEPISILLG
jgi:acyl-CoA synthetase (AMP-forming)/AMP-acid ligase II